MFSTNFRKNLLPFCIKLIFEKSKMAANMGTCCETTVAIATVLN